MSIVVGKEGRGRKKQHSLNIVLHFGSLFLTIFCPFQAKNSLETQMLNLNSDLKTAREQTEKVRGEKVL